MKKHYFLIAAALLSAALMSSCRKDAVATAPEDSASTLEVSVCGIEKPSTKADLQSADEASLSSFEVFIYMSTDKTTPYIRKTISGTSGTISLPQGKTYTVYALANMTNLSDVTSESSLTSKNIPYGDNSRTSFAMSAAPQTVTLNGNKSLTFQMERLCSKVLISGNIQLDFSENPYLAAKTSSIKSVFLTQVPASCSAITATPSSTYVMTGNPAGSTGLVSGSPEISFCNNQSGVSPWGQLTLYGYPNTATEASSRSGIDKVTKVAVCVNIGGEFHYYTIGIPNMARNTIYTISDIRITREGASTPESYVPDKATLTCTIKVKDWVPGAITGSYNEFETGGSVVFRRQ